jgi:hypothetical protein
MMRFTVGMEELHKPGFAISGHFQIKFSVRRLPSSHSRAPIDRIPRFSRVYHSTLVWAVPWGKTCSIFLEFRPEGLPLRRSLFIPFDPLIVALLG